MISLAQTETPSEHVQLRSRKMRVEFLSYDLYIVVPGEPGRAKRLVHIDMDEVRDIKIECVDKETGDVCPANNYSKHCSHVESALQFFHLLIERELI